MIDLYALGNCAQIGDFPADMNRRKPIGLDKASCRMSPWERKQQRYAALRTVNDGLAQNGRGHSSLRRRIPGPNGRFRPSPDIGGSAGYQWMHSRHGVIEGSHLVRLHSKGHAGQEIGPAIHHDGHHRDRPACRSRPGAASSSPQDFVVFRETSTDAIPNPIRPLSVKVCFNRRAMP